MGGVGRVIPISSAAQPPPRRRSSSSPIQSTAQKPNPRQHQTLENPISRRNALLLLSAAAASSLALSPAALSLGISGPKEWLKDQKRKASRFVLAPIEASRQSLRSAYLLLSQESESPGDNPEELMRLLSSASRDCVPQTRSSLVAFQARTGVEVCTFRLIVNNAASLLDERDPVKLEAEATLDDLIRSFYFLGDVIDSSNFKLAGDRQKAKDGLMDAISTLDKFEQGIKDCLGV